MGREQLSREQLQEELRGHALRFVALIRARQGAWESTGAWLRTLPLCWQVKETNDPDHPAVRSGEYLWIRDDLPGTWYEYSADTEESIQHPTIGRRMVEAWQATVSRFRDRYSDRFHDFGMDDAKRIALLAALTFDRDFDGSEFGLGWRWDQPRSEDFTPNCRGWGWAALTSGLFAEESLHEYVSVAAEFLAIRESDLGKEAPTLVPVAVPLTETQAQVAELLSGVQRVLRSAATIGITTNRSTGKTEGSTGDPRYPDGDWIRVTHAADKFGVNPKTLHRWVQELPSAVRGETEPRRTTVVSRSALIELLRKRRPDALRDET